jgi:hypothetical protein
MSTFQSTQQLLDFAEKFFDDRRGPFCADVAVCLTPDDSDHRAEFPALITCIAFVELWSGLHVGNLGGDGLRKLQSYAAQFMNRTHYDPLLLKILYLVFRHKLAHISFPHFVFDTSATTKFQGDKHRRITWTVDHEARTVPISLDDHGTKYLQQAVTPWRMAYDCRVTISVPTFQRDIINSIEGPAGYLANLKGDPTAQANFDKCIAKMFPP